MNQTKLPKRTLWYPGNVKPVRVGAYEKVHNSFEKCYQWWNGKWWGICCISPDYAMAYNDQESQYQTLPWRGLEEKAK
jgi:hypothetical protein